MTRERHENAFQFMLHPNMMLDYHGHEPIKYGKYATNDKQRKEKRYMQKKILNLTKTF